MLASKSLELKGDSRFKKSSRPSAAGVHGSLISMIKRHALCPFHLVLALNDGYFSSCSGP